MSDFDNIFDAAISGVDDTILDVMGTEASITSGIMAGAKLQAFSTILKILVTPGGSARGRDFTVALCQISVRPSVASYGHADHQQRSVLG